MDQIKDFFDFMATLHSSELCALAEVRGSHVNTVPGLRDKLDIFEETFGFTVTTPQGNLNSTFSRIARGAVEFDENRDIATFNPERGMQAYKQIENSLYKQKPASTYRN